MMFQRCGVLKDEIYLPEFADTKDICDLFTMWRKWRGENLIPYDAMANMPDLGECLDAALLLQMDTPDTFTILYCGSLLVKYYGKDYTGHNYLDLTNDQHQNKRAKRLEAMIQMPCAGVGALRGALFGLERSLALGVSLPFAPQAEGHATQLLQVCILAPDIKQPTMSKEDQNTKVYIDRFKFVDIGAGRGASDLESLF